MTVVRGGGGGSKTETGKRKKKNNVCVADSVAVGMMFFFLTLQSDSVCFLFISLSWVWRALFWLVSIWSRSCSAERSCSCRPICLLCIWFYSWERKRWRVLVQQQAAVLVSSLANKVKNGILTPPFIAFIMVKHYWWFLECKYECVLVPSLKDFTDWSHFLHLGKSRSAIKNSFFCSLSWFTVSFQFSKYTSNTSKEKCCK